MGANAAISGPAQITEGGVVSSPNIYFNVPAPGITSIAPAIGGAGNAVTITGTGFHATKAGNTTVTFICFGSGVCETVIVGTVIIGGVAYIGYEGYHYLKDAKAKRIPKPSPGKPAEKCDKNRKDACDQRFAAETAFCLAEYGNYPNLLQKCTERAMWRWNNCLRGIPDPGVLDPLDPTWSLN